MSVNANNYIMSFSSPTVPRLDASNINTISIEDMNLRIAQYEGKVTTYKNAYSNYVSLKKYIEGRLMKDLASQQNSGVLGRRDLTANTFVANIKADNYFNYAKGASQLTSTTDIDTIKNKMTELINNFYYTQDNGSGDKDWYTGTTFPSTTYDDRAIVLNISQFDQQQEQNIIFISDIANATSTDRTYTAYVLVEGQTVETKNYTISFDIRQTINVVNDSQTSRVQNPTYNKWVLKNSSDEIIAVCDEFPQVTQYTENTVNADITFSKYPQTVTE